MPFLLVKNIYCTIQLGVVIAVSLWCHFNVLRVSTFIINPRGKIHLNKNYCGKKAEQATDSALAGNEEGKKSPL